MDAFDVVTVGDALIDTFLSINKQGKYGTIDESKGEICFVSGAKNLVDDAQFLLGGNACNVAVGLSRYGLASALTAEIGDDEFSEKITRGLVDDNVSLDLLKRTAQAPSTFSICLTFMQERTLFVRHVLRDHAFNFDHVKTKWIYLTSLGKEWKNTYQVVKAFVEKTGVKLAFNPGSMQLTDGREGFRDILTVSEILFVNKEEAEEIVYGALQHTESTANSIETLLFELHKLGPRYVCITDGTNGSYMLADDQIHHQGIVPCKVVEKTGAGDAYATGVLAGILSQVSLPEAMVWGALESASVIEHVGAESGLLTKEQLLERMKQIK